MLGSNVASSVTIRAGDYGMKNKAIFAFLSALAATSTLPSTANAASIIVDGSFEQQGSSATFYSRPNAAVGNRDGYCYFSAPGLACGNTGSPWSGSGLINPPSAFGQPSSAQNGNYYSFIQSTQVLSQTFVSSLAGISNLSFWTAGRSGFGGNQTVDILLNSIFVGSFTTGQNTPTWVNRNFNVNVAAGTNTLEFRGRASGDQTAFIDNISIPAVPEPSTWALFMLGIGFVGFSMRRRQGVVARLSFS